MFSAPQLRTRHAVLAGVVLSLGACVFGYRGQVDFADEASLSGVETVQLVLPPTSLVLAGDAARTFVDWQGSFISLGGSSNDALDSARKAELRWETWEQVGRLSAVLPVEIRDLTHLDHLDVESAGYLAHEIVGTGDVFVTGIDAYVSVTLDGGDVEIIGGTDHLDVETARGDVTLSTSAAATVTSGFGQVTIQAEVARDLDIETTGPVHIELADATNLDIDIAGAGQIVVDLDTAAHVGAGSYRRELGTAATRLHVRSNGGAVELTMLETTP